MHINNLTFIITTYKSEKTIYSCLDSLPQTVNKIIIENSNSYELKIDLERKYENLKCYVMSENIGYGKANNYGINESQTEYVFILNPDAKLLKNTLKNMLESLRDENFSIAAPVDINEIKNFDFKTKDLIDVDFVKGFAMLLNKKNFLNGFFDENIFLYLEEIDLCKRVKKENGRIILVNTSIIHEGGVSHGKRDDIEMEKSRNWHWTWSKFYYNRKHRGYFYGFIKTLPNFFTAVLKFFIYSLINKNSKKDIYKMRILGLLNSYLLKKSFYRPYVKN